MDIDDKMSEDLYVKLLELEKVVRGGLTEEDEDLLAHKQYLNHTD